MDISWNDFQTGFINQQSGTNLVIRTHLTTLPLFCVGIKFTLDVGGIIPSVKFFCSTNGMPITTETAAKDVIELNTVNVIPPELYLVAGLMYKRVKSWQEGLVTLSGVALNSTEYSTTMRFKDH